MPQKRINIFSVDSDPAIDRALIRKSANYCEGEVVAGRARMLDQNDLAKGIQLIPQRTGHKTDIRGSKEQSGALTAHESVLNAQYRGFLTDIALLSQKYELHLEQHLLNGRKGTPRACNVIAARVKTLLSNPTDHA